jgi:hypothetical protein
VVLLLGDGLARAQSLDGTYVTIGPVAGGARVEGEWLSAVGLELSLVRVTETALPGALGVCAGGVSYAGRKGGRLWLEVEAALAAPLPFPIGLGAGAAAEVDRIEPARLGGQATLWFLAGFVPYVRAGAVERSGAFIEAGVMLKIPARRFP